MQEHWEERYSKQKPNKKALVIAVSQYDSSSLKPIKFCENDGQEMYRVLKKLGYEIPDSCKLIGYVKSEGSKRLSTTFLLINIIPLMIRWFSIILVMVFPTNGVQHFWLLLILILTTLLWQGFPLLT